MLKLSMLSLSLWFAAIPAGAQWNDDARGGAEAATRQPLGRKEFQVLLQRFVDKLYLKAFRHLGDERDFDHGHILFSEAGRPSAILYHTQEMAYDYPAGSEFGYVDSSGRNWIQRIDDGTIENADSYVRKDFPKTAYWDWFQQAKLPALKERHTIVDKMLDPQRVGARTSESTQWAFHRQDCAEPNAERITVRLPGGENVCLALSAS